MALPSPTPLRSRWQCAPPRAAEWAWGRRLLVVLAAAFGSALACACQLVFPTVAEDASAPVDARVDTLGEARSDSSFDVGAPEGASGPYNAFTDKTQWEAYNFSSGYTFAGGTFDGRYLYLTPWGGPAARYDTHARFTAASSWEGFDTRTISEAGVTHALSFFVGAVFDGRFVYFIPQNDGIPWDLIVARFDVSAKRFDDPTAWLSFDLTTAFGVAVQAFSGAAFDGRYIYLVPALNGTVLRYDTMAPFGTTSSWVPFDMTTVNGAASGLLGAIYDGRYVYFVPSQNAAYVALDAGGGIYGTPDGIVMRYDTTAPFVTPASWTSFDTTRLGGMNTQGFAGGVFDGHYLYLCPYYGLTGVIPRLDIDAGFLDRKAWSTFTANSASPNANGFLGGAYDGRYVYMVPNTDAPSVNDGVAVRYDTTATFSHADSWSAYDMQAQLGVSAVGFEGAVFDGEYLYFVPGFYTTVVRFHSRNTRALPKLPDFHGSFL